ncbi:MAG TPA: hypothetical protein VLR93_00975 [Patescibacteria group bacterium]|nr:hypothetical protein [Patescibacteria group bacterium]
MHTSAAEVIRLFRFRPVRTAFDSILRDDMIPALHEMDGIVDLYVGRQGPDELGPRVIATIWTSRDAMAAGVGESFDRPIFRPEYLAETVDRSLEFLPLDIGLRFERADRPGVVRLFEGQVRPGELDAYVDDARAGTLLDAAAGSGPMALYLARRTADAFVTLSVWPDWSTLQDATGGDVERPIATRHAHRLVAWHAEHYESIPGLTPPRPTPATTS